MSDNCDTDFETFLKASSPYKGLTFFEKTFDFLKDKIDKAKKQLKTDLYKEALGDFISYASEHCYGIKKTAIVSLNVKMNKKLHIKECILSSVSNEEYRNKANKIIKNHIDEKSPLLTPGDLKGLVLDIRC